MAVEDFRAQAYAANVAAGKVGGYLESNRKCVEVDCTTRARYLVANPYVVSFRAYCRAHMARAVAVACAVEYDARAAGFRVPVQVLPVDVWPDE